MTGDTAQILQLHLKYVCKWAGRSFIENNYKIPSTAVDLWFTGMVTIVPSVVVLWPLHNTETIHHLVFLRVFAPLLVSPDRQLQQRAAGRPLN